jgi:seryl-tRNA synthetase
MNETKEQFDLRHGAFIVDNGMKIFEDGACRELNMNGFFQEPPTDEVQRLKYIRRFYEIKLQLSVTKFDHVKRQYLSESRAMLSQKGNVGGVRRDIDDVKKELNDLKDVANEYKTELDKVMKRLEELMPKQVQLEKIEAANRAAHTEFITEVEKIEI